MVTLERTPDGRRLVTERAVEAPVDTVWDVLIDTRRWPDWGPSVTAVDCERRRIDAGTRGRVRTVGGVWLPFEVTACAPYRWTWNVARLPATGHFVRPAAGETTVVGFEVPPLLAGYLPVCERGLDRVAAIVRN